MGFQIKDENGNAIAINTLDEQVCELWEVPVDKESYARPNARDAYPEGRKGNWDYLNQSNWYDTIGYMIHSDKLTSWDGVLKALEELHCGILEQYSITLEELSPKKVMLIRHWEALGYTPIHCD